MITNDYISALSCPSNHLSSPLPFSSSLLYPLLLLLYCLFVMSLFLGAVSVLEENFQEISLTQELPFGLVPSLGKSSIKFYCKDLESVLFVDVLSGISFLPPSQTDSFRLTSCYSFWAWPWVSDSYYARAWDSKSFFQFLANRYFNVFSSLFSSYFYSMHFFSKWL